ncbi:MAG TPA: bluetail domain-containing putative surface protein, partial [Rhizomicrobium sp.]
LDDGNNFDITVTGGFGGEAGLNIDASALSARYGATIDMSGLTNFSLDFTGGAGDDTVLAGADLGNMTIDGGTGTNVLKLDGDYSAGVTLSSITNIAEIDLAGGNAYNLTTTGVTVAAGVTLTVDASALGPNFGLTFNGSAETDGYFNIKGGAGDDSLTLQTRAVDNSTIDGGAGFNTVTLTGNLGGDESFNAASFTHIDSIDYAVGSFGGELSFTGDVTGDGSTLTVDETNADGFGGSGPDGDMLFTDISALTDTIDLTGAVVDDFVVVGSVNWTSLNGNGGNYNALIDTGTDPITFDAATITGFNTLVFAFDLNGNAVDFSGIGVVGDLTGNGGTLTIDAGFSSSISIDLSQATSDIAFDGSTGDDTITFGNNFSSGDMIQGNGGNDTLGLGRNTATLADTAVTGVGTVTLSGGSAFAVTGDISGNGLLTVDAGAVSDPLDNVNIDFSQATTATVDFTGGAGGDRVTFDASESNWGTVDGGTGINNFILNTGGAASIDGDSVTDFSAITLRDGGSYTLTLSGDIQGGGEALSVQASALSGGNSVSVDASASTDKISFIGGAGDDTFTGSNQGDMIGLGSGGIDTVRGGTGDDTITVSASSVGGDSIDGGAGVNTLNLSGSGEVDLNGAALTNIQTLNLSSNDVVIAGDIAGGQALTIDAANTHGLSLDLTQATTSSIAVTGGDGDDSIFFASQFAHLGTVDGGAGYDTIRSSGTLTLSDATISRVENVVYSDDDAGNAGLTITGDITTGGGALAIYAAGVGPSVYNAIDLAAATTATINVTGGAGNDLVTFSAGAHNWGTVDGGDGDNTFQLTGGSTGATIDGASVTHFSTLSFNDGYSYSGIILQNDITGSGGTLAIDASGLTGSNSVTIDASQATSAIDFAGGAGDDTVIFSQPSFFAEESYDGGAGYNTIAITPNDGSLGNFLYNLGDAYFTDLDEIDLQNGSNQGVQVTGDVSHTGTLKIDASALGAAYQATIDASAATSSIAFTGGAGDDTITASNSSHETDLDLSQGGEDTVHGGSASDFIYMGNALDTGDRIDGGGGFNYVYLEGDSYAGGLNLGAGELANVNYVQMFGNHTYVLTGDPAALNSSNFVTIDGGAMTGGSLQFDGSAVTDGTFSLYGGQGNDILLAGSGSDTLDLSVGGEDQLAGNGGNDIINAGGGLDAGDTVDGGAGTDTLNLNGDYSGGLVLGATTVTNVETFNFTAGHSYNITTNDATVASGLTLTVSASALGAGDSLTFNGAAETDGIFSITGGAGNDVITGGAQADSITIGTGGNDTVHGGDGNDQIFMMTQWTSADVLDGGAGNDFVGWGGKDYTGASALVLSATSLNSVEEIQCNNSHAYSLTMNDANVAAGATVLIDSTRSTKFTFNGSAETDGHFQIAGGAGADVLTAGQLSDTFIFYAVAGSTSTGYDTITNMNFSSDLLWLESGNGFTTDYKPTGVDAAITTGALSTATFNTNLAAAVNSSTLAAGHAVLFTANSGTLSGHTFLVVDHNGIAGYQASSDYVIDVTGDTGTLSTASFT